MTNIIHGLTQNGIPRSLLSTTRAAGAVYQADANGDIAGHSLPTLEVARNADYDQYSLYNQLYYGGQISDIDVTGLRGLAFDGFVDSKFVDAGNALTIDTTNKKAVHGGKVVGLRDDGINIANPSYTYAGGQGNFYTVLTFRAAFSGKIEKVKIWMQRGGAETVINCTLFPNDAGGIDGWNPAAALGVTPDYTIPAVKAPIEFIFPTPIPIVEGKVYGFRFYCPSSSSVAHSTYGANNVNAPYNYAVTEQARQLVVGNSSMGTNGILSAVVTASDVSYTEKILIPKPKVLTFAPTSLTLYLSVLSAFGESYIPEISFDNGVTWQAMTDAFQRVDPKFASYVEHRFTLQPTSPTTNMRMRVRVRGGEVKRYGLLMA